MPEQKELSTEPQLRRRLSDAELQDVKEQLLESVYADIGKSLVKKILWVFGAVVLAAFAWLSGKGLVRLD